MYILFLYFSESTNDKDATTTETASLSPLYLDDDDEFIRRVRDSFTARFAARDVSWSAPPSYRDWTVSDVYMSVTKDIVDTVRYYMRMFCEREGISTSSSSDNSTGLPAVYSLYKFADYFMPLSASNISKANRLELLCKRCKIRGIYRPCARVQKIKVFHIFRSMCLQCYFEVSVMDDVDDKSLVEMKKATEDAKLPCTCHAFSMVLLFPAVIMFASDSVKGRVIKQHIVHRLCSAAADYPIGMFGVGASSSGAFGRSREIDIANLRLLRWRIYV